MRLCLPTTWDAEYLKSLAELPSGEGVVYEVFGALPRSITGSGRDAAIVHDVTPAQLAEHVRLAHTLGIKFNYLLNTACLGGAEFVPQGLERIRRYVAWIQDIGADAVTVTLPFLLELVRDVAPGLEINVSTIAHVDTVRKAHFFEELGAHRITVSLMVNRDLERLAALRRSVSCSLEVLANELCLYQCPYRDYHYTLMSHGSRGQRSQADIEYPHLKCTLHRLEHPAELLKARFIRPEDVAAYEELGIDLIKLAGRGKTGDALLRAARAYLARRYEGNLVDITDLGLYSTPQQDRPEIFVDNSALDGLLAHMSTVSCDTQCGTQCTYCEQLAERAVRIRRSSAYLTRLTARDRELLRGDDE